jgi:hypothetical protein
MTGFQASSKFEINHDPQNYPLWINYFSTNCDETTWEGLSSFERLSILDSNQEEVRVRYQFFVGDNVRGFYLVTEPTRVYTFKSSDKVALGEHYSRAISAN